MVDLRLPKDPPLTVFGESQAKELAKYFLSLDQDQRPTLLFSSPYYRCLQTSQPIAAALELPIFVEHGISEWYSPATPGTGLHPRPASASDLKKYFTEIDAQTWSSIHYPSRKGEDVEQVHHRANVVLSDLISEIQVRFPNHKRILLVSHAGTVIALARELAGDRNMPLRVGCCSLTEFVRTKKDDGVGGGSGWKMKKGAEADFLTGGVQRDWGFEDIQIADGKVVDDIGVPGSEGEVDEPVGSMLRGNHGTNVLIWNRQSVGRGQYFNVDLVALQLPNFSTFLLTNVVLLSQLVWSLSKNQAMLVCTPSEFRTGISLLDCPGEATFQNRMRGGRNGLYRTSLPVPIVYAYCSESSNPVGAEWIIMEQMPGVQMGMAWDKLQLVQKQTLARNLVDVYDQLYRLKADGCGGIYYGVNPTMYDLGPLSRSPRWAPLSSESFRQLRSHCRHPIKDGYELGPIHDISLISYWLMVPTPSQTMPIFSSEEYIKLVAFNGHPPTRSDFDLPTRENCVELFQHIQALYPNSPLLGESNTSSFRFSHGDLHSGNILIDPHSGKITGIVDWEAAAFRPLWATVFGVCWFEEDGQRFILGMDEPGNFEDDVKPEDAILRAFFRCELNKRNPDLFSCFLGGVELQAVLHAAIDDPRPVGKSHIFLIQYYEFGYWDEARRGAFPWDMDAWRHRWLLLDWEGQTFAELPGAGFDMDS
ncbi:hypothetical protein D9757_002887 [Collybiopsis confluens]|uniref:Aminoglycoside phosphotransferase domain-containing protein n=1 Tax=Collybiopsis confluens TaxID=2823264 RepID=A0A8H5HVG0_9AGAR|nr:hypothetical protein D9757_002887 [Collybiopsis confluens]